MSSKISGMHVESTKSEPGAVSRHEQNRVDPAKIQPGNVMKPSPNSGSSSTFMPTASMSHSVLQPTKTSSNPDVGQTSTNGMASKPMKLSSPAFPAYVNNVVKPDWDADGWGNDLIDFVRFDNNSSWNPIYWLNQDDAAGGWSGSVAAKPIATKSDSASFGASNTTPALAESNGWGDESDMDWGAWSTPADAASKVNHCILLLVAKSLKKK